MPNHTATILCLEGDPAQIEALNRAIGAELDFNSLYPCPSELHDVASPVRLVSEDEFEKEKTRYAEAKAEKQQWLCGISITEKYQQELLQRFGADCWYDWCLKNWGTKWGMYDAARISDVVYSYNTAWSPASEFWAHVSKAYPAVTFRHSFADEGGGFVGYEVINNGQVIDSGDYEWNSKPGLLLRKLVGYGPCEEDEDEDGAPDGSDAPAEACDRTPAEATESAVDATQVREPLTDGLTAPRRNDAPIVDPR